MDPVLLSRWQFALTTIYHFFFRDKKPPQPYVHPVQMQPQPPYPQQPPQPYQQQPAQPYPQPPIPPYQEQMPPQYRQPPQYPQ